MKNSKTVKNITTLLREYKGFMIFIFFMMMFRSAIADWNTVPTGSMNPTIVEGDRISINKLAYDVKLPFIGHTIAKLDDPKRGEIVVFNSKVADVRLIKRVIGIPGDSVEMIDNQLIVNGKMLLNKNTNIDQSVLESNESLAGKVYSIQRHLDGSNADTFSKVIVPDNQYLVLGDNRDNSADSRFIGFVPREEIIGRSSFVVMSLNYDNFYLPRADRFFKEL